MTSLNPEVALRYATCTQEEQDSGLCPVIFIFLIQNMMKFAGFRMDKPHFSSHYDDDEVLLMDNQMMFVVKVHDYIYKTMMPTLKQYNEKKYTVIHLFNHS